MHRSRAANVVLNVRALSVCRVRCPRAWEAAFLFCSHALPCWCLTLSALIIILALKCGLGICPKWSCISPKWLCFYLVPGLSTTPSYPKLISWFEDFNAEQSAVNLNSNTFQGRKFRIYRGAPPGSLTQRTTDCILSIFCWLLVGEFIP